MQIKTTMSYHLTPVRVNKQVLERMWRKGNPSALWVGMQIGAATVGNIMEGPPKIKNKTALWPRNSSSEVYIQRNQNTNLKGYMHPYIHYSYL